VSAVAGIEASGRAVAVWPRRRSRSASRRITDSVIRSASAAPICAPSMPCPVTLHSVARSIRVIAASPQTCAMSVAFDDQGDTVPTRGVMKNESVSIVSALNCEPGGTTTSIAEGP
jgi:hypothetical protein